MTIKAVVFDCDGVLTDSEPAWGEAERELCRRHGVDPARVDQFMTAGLSMADTVRVLLGGDPVGGIGQAEDLLVSIAATTIPSVVRPLPGAIDLVRQLSDRIPVGVASNTPRRVLEPVLAALGITPFLTTVTSADDVANPKPAPDLYLRTCLDLHLHASSVMVLEDSPTGIRAAQTAGCQVVQVMADGMEELTGVVGRLRSLTVTAEDLLALLGSR